MSPLPFSFLSRVPIGRFSVKNKIICRLRIRQMAVRYSKTLNSDPTSGTSRCLLRGGHETLQPPERC